MAIIDTDRHLINGKNAAYTDFLFAEIIFRHGVVDRATVEEAIRTDRHRRGRKPASCEAMASNCALRRVRILLAGSGYRIKNIYGFGFKVIGPGYQEYTPYDCNDCNGVFNYTGELVGELRHASEIENRSAGRKVIEPCP